MVVRGRIVRVSSAECVKLKMRRKNNSGALVAAFTARGVKNLMRSCAPNAPRKHVDLCVGRLANSRHS